MQAALKDPRNLAFNSRRLLVRSTWPELARADAGAAGCQAEPHTWAQITLARALLAEKQPLRRTLFALRDNTEGSRRWNMVATTLASVGLYEETSRILVQAFSLKDANETRLANRIPARAASFSELLAPERRASIFQPAPATQKQCGSLKTLLSFTCS